MIHHQAYSEILKEHPYLEQSVGKSTDVDSRKKSESTHDERSKKRFVLQFGLLQFYVQQFSLYIAILMHRTAVSFQILHKRSTHPNMVSSERVADSWFSRQKIDRCAVGLAIIYANLQFIYRNLLRNLHDPQAARHNRWFTCSRKLFSCNPHHILPNVP